jgi:hypothetical protein
MIIDPFVPYVLHDLVNEPHTKCSINFECVSHASYFHKFVGPSLRAYTSIFYFLSFVILM